MVGVSSGGACSCRAAPAAKVCAYHWLHGSHTLLVLGVGQLARLDLDAAPPEGQLALQWVPAPAAAAAQGMSTASVPGGASLFVLDCQPSTEGAEAALTLYDCASLGLSGAWTRVMPAQPSPPRESVWRQCASVHATSHAVAICCTKWRGLWPHGTWVWAFDGCELGDLLFSRQELIKVSFSPCGCFICGILSAPEPAQSTSHLVLDARTGAAVLVLPGLHQAPLLRSAKPLTIVWVGDSQLHVGSTQAWVPKTEEVPSTDAGVFYRILQY